MISLKELLKVKTLYCCGLTTNSTPHVGHARTFLVAITLKKVIENETGYAPRLIINWTDVDPKIGYLTASDYITLSLNNVQHAKRELSAVVNWTKVDVEPKVSAYIPEIIQDILQLEREGQTYPDELGVRLKDVTHELLNFKGERGFYLWRFSKVGFSSPWGIGIPGWHLECSTMISRNIGVADLHLGGKDLCFPHHLNEDLLHQLLHGKSVTKSWIHVGLLNVQGIKMSKSLGNVTLVSSLTKDWLSALALKVYLLWTHVEKTMSFSKEELRKVHGLCAKLIWHDPTQTVNSTKIKDLTKRWVKEPSLLNLMKEDNFSLDTLTYLCVKLGIIEREELLLVRNSLLRLQILREGLRFLRRFQCSDTLRTHIFTSFGVWLKDRSLT